MSNVVQFLEALGRNPQSLSAEKLAAAVAGATLDPAVQQALLDRDTEALNQLLGGTATVSCLIAPAENDEPQEGEEHDGDGEVPEEQASYRVA